MYKKLLVLSVAVSGLVYFPSLFAHNEGKTFVDSEVKRKAAEEQQERDSWDSFMNAVKSQEKEQAADKQPVDTDDHSKHSGH